VLLLVERREDDAMEVNAQGEQQAENFSDTKNMKFARKKSSLVARGRRRRWKL
jgi:hypothetical protein